MKPRPAATLAALLLGTAIHVDWHLARPGHHNNLSGGLALHWLLAIPVFGILALVVSHAPPAERRQRGAVWIAGGILVGQILEPLGEVLVYRLPWEQLTVGIRWIAFTEFMVLGMLTFLLVLGARARSPGTTP